MSLLFLILASLFLGTFTRMAKGCVMVFAALMLLAWASRHYPEMTHEVWDLADQVRQWIFNNHDF